MKDQHAMLLPDRSKLVFRNGIEVPCGLGLGNYLISQRPCRYQQKHSAFGDVSKRRISESKYSPSV